MASIEAVVSSMIDRFPGGVVRVERQIHAGRRTIRPAGDPAPSGDVAASTFALLEAVSQVGAPSEALSREWAEARAGLLRLSRP